VLQQQMIKCYVSVEAQTHRALFVCVTQELKNFLNRVGEVTFADAHKEHLNEGLDIHCD